MSEYLRAPSRVSRTSEQNCRPLGGSVIDSTTKPGIGRVVQYLALAGLLLVPWSAAAELAPAVQADLYLVQMEAYIKAKDYAGATEAMSKMTALRKEHDITPPDDFHFKYAQVLGLAGAHTEAVASLTRYIELTGNTGQHYWDALELLHREMETAELTRAGRMLRDCAECPELVVVPAGTFMMGSPSSEEGRSDAEGPRHRVTIGGSVAVGMYEVTFAEWDACVGAGGCGGYRPDDEGWGHGKRPVINVSWEDSQGYVRWLSGRTGKEYRLLSESEWEYAARADTAAPFHFGARISTSQANYDRDYTYGFGRTGENLRQTAEVGTFEANSFGLHDVHGNVWEWVEDCWNDRYEGAPSDGSAWERGDCSGRLVRGGSWYDEPGELRSASRYPVTTGTRDRYLGFRVARTLTTYRSGRHAEEAERLQLQEQARDDEAFMRAQSEGTATAYGTYLRTYGSGRYAAEARRLQAQAVEPKRVGSVFRDCEECPEMVIVPAGTFMMGAPSSEEGRSDSEGPRHQVTIGDPLAVGVYEVTKGEFGAFVRATTERAMGDTCLTWEDGKWEIRRGRTWLDPGYRQTDREPVVCVSWEDAQGYVRWLSGRTGKEFRLLSESEWEYAARGGTATPFHFGSTISTSQANYNGNYRNGNGHWGEYRERTVEVGRFAANSFGLHEVHGNVWEWVEDCWNDSYEAAPSDGSAWERDYCDLRVLRGGSWDSSPRFLRSAHRNGSEPGNRTVRIGFRVARTLTRQE